MRGVLYDNLGINEGMFFENAVAAELTDCGFELLFHSVKDQRHLEKTMEIDFVVRSGIKICRNLHETSIASVFATRILSSEFPQLV